MYDQFRVSGVRAQFELVGASQPSGLSVNQIAYTFASAMDRNGVILDSNDQYTITPFQLQGMSSYLPSTYYNGAKFRQTRVFYPSTMLERSQYLSTASPIAFVPSDSPTQFNPWMYFQVSRLGGPSVAASQDFTIVVNFDVACTFRALRLNNRNWSPSSPSNPLPYVFAGYYDGPNFISAGEFIPGNGDSFFIPA